MLLPAYSLVDEHVSHILKYKYSYTPYPPGNPFANKSAPG
jgi:hypothetical protein